MKKWVLVTLLTLVAFTLRAAPPPASDVFKLETHLIDPNTFALTWHIKPGFFLYSDRLKLTLDSPALMQLGALRLPHPETKVDAQEKHYTVYRNILSLPVNVLAQGAQEALVNVHYQGCSDKGFCYPPQTAIIKLTVNNDNALTDVIIETTPSSNTASPPDSTPSTAVEAVFTDHHWLITLLSFFVFGLLLSFTPCVLPMVPILSGIIVGHGKDITTRKAFLLSLSYVLSMSLTYALVGAIVALLGENLQIIMQTPWVIALFSSLFIVLALAMFDVYQLTLPTSWQIKLATLTKKQESGHYLGAAIMGTLSTLILSPCVTAPLIGALSYIAHSGNVVLGVFSLFFVGLGMGTPLLFIGTSAGKWLPHTGRWMNSVKAFFGIVMIAVAITLLSRILPALIIMFLWSCLAIFTGLFCGVFQSGVSPYERLHQGIGLIFLVYGLLILIGVSMGQTNPLQPLAHIRHTEDTPIASFIKPVTSIRAASNALTKAEGKPVMLDFYADWCTSCKVMEATTLKDKKVLNKLSQFTVIKADITANSSREQALLSHFNVIAPPSYLFFDKNGHELAHLRLVGEVNPKEFLSQLNKVTQKSQRN